MRIGSRSYFATSKNMSAGSYTRHSPQKSFVVTLDGPAAVGKSSVACRVAQDLNLAYLDSGSLYRTIALLFHREYLQRSAENGAEEITAGHFDHALTSILDHFAKPGLFQVAWENSRPRVLFSGSDIEAAIRQEQNGKLTSLISQRPIVRERLMAYQHAFARQHDRTIAVGRDAGSLVFPDADLKIFLTASIKVRARRRWLELKNSGHTTTLREVMQAVAQRDDQDRKRPLAPLIVPKGAKKIITSTKSLDVVVQDVKDLVERA